jgi:hypothetical protein
LTTENNMWGDLMEYGREQATNLVEAAKQMLHDAGFIGGTHDSVFARQVSHGVVELARVFQDQRFSALCGRLVAALFSRLARGSFPTPEFLGKVREEIEEAAKDDPYDEQEERTRWIQQRYPTLRWAGDLHSHIRDMVFPRRDDNEGRSDERFAGAPLHRDGPKDEDDPVLRPAKTIRMSDIRSMLSDGRFVQAVLEYRRATGIGLREARDFVYTLCGNMNQGQGGGYVPGAQSGTLAMNRLVLHPGNMEKALGFPPGSLPVRSEGDKETNMDVKTKTVGIIREFCKDMKAFTSLDVSNKAKAEGLVARHREVAELVREAFADGEMGEYGYDRSLIDVTLRGGGSAQAYLYHHSTVSVDNYIDRAQTADRVPAPQGTSQAVPDAAGDCAASVPDSSTPQATPAAVATPAASNRLTRILNTTTSVVRFQKGDGRLEVPRVWLARLGWNAGDTVDAVRDGNSLILKTGALHGEQVLRTFTVDRWCRIRITTKVLNQTGIHFGTGGQHVATLRAADIKID